MKWYESDVASAISVVQNQNICLFVFVSNGNDSSQEYLDGIEKNDAIKLILDNMICLKIIGESDEYKQFSAVYPVKEIPSIHVISPTGRYLKHIFGNYDEEKIVGELKTCSSDAGDMNLLEESNETKPSSSNEPDQEDKSLYYQNILEEKRKKRIEEEKEKERQREIERRTIGKELNTFKLSKKEMEEKELRDEIKRTREENKAAREKILRQIEQDKLERKQRMGQNVTVPEKTELNETEVRNRTPIELGDSARIQFRFPDGHSINNRFENETKFSDIRKYVANYIREQYKEDKQFEISQFFPKRKFEIEDNDKTVIELQLNPSTSLAVTFLVQQKNPLSTISVSDWVLWPFNAILRFFYIILTWFQKPTPMRIDERPKPNTMDDRNKRLLAAEGRTIKKEGNLAKFSDKKPNTDKRNDDDDDEARWNGNSTQQM